MTPPLGPNLEKKNWENFESWDPPSEKNVSLKQLKLPLKLTYSYFN